MVKSGIKPNVISYNAAISAYEKGGQWQKALELLREMAKNGIKPNVISYNAAISACEKGGQWQKALELLGEMAKNGIKPNVISYSDAITVCFNAERYVEANMLTQKVLSEGHCVNFYTAKLRTWDLHDLSFAVACTLLLESLFSVVESKRHCELSFPDIVVITGKGVRSGSGGPVLQSKAPQFLGDIGLETTQIKENEGRFLITGEAVDAWGESPKFI